MKSSSLAVRNYKTQEKTTEWVSEFVARAQEEIKNKIL
jgi:threonyl-tRNA synthetase